MTNKTEKPWGYELLIVANERYALKDIFIKAGTRSSLQYHTKKLETILLLSGRLTLEWGPGVGAYEQKDYAAGESYSVPPGTHHRVTALEDTRLIEVSTPDLDDVVRVQDDYGRASANR
jgi:mannose-6-phosphate isomerase-like protein (cupin superfamily)